MFEFVECDRCSSFPGTPPLCNGCRANRETIKELRKLVSDGLGEEFLADAREFEVAMLAEISRILFYHSDKFQSLSAINKGDHPEANPTSWRFSYAGSEYSIHIIRDGSAS